MKLSEIISEMWGAPADVALNLARITIIGDREIMLENHRGIMLCRENEIIVRTEKGMVRICGKNLEIRHIRAVDLMIRGIFDSIEFNSNMTKS